MRAILRWFGCVLIAAFALQLFFILRIAAMVVIDPQSTAFQRSEAWQIQVHGRTNGPGEWRQRWVPYDQIADSLKRAVIASEDADFLYHQGVEWDAIEKARERNAKAEEVAARRAAEAAKRGKTARPPKLRGGSTISQQLAKNLFLSGERTLLRKGQELVLTMMLEVLLDKQRILALYLNSVEWGEGVFGAEAAAQRYFNKPAARLTANEAARLAVMLPSPKFFERRPGSSYIVGRAATIVARMPSAELP